MVFSLAVAASLLGAWELTVTRLSSIYYFFDTTYLVLAVCLLGLGIGALWCRSYGEGLKLRYVLVAIPITMLLIWGLISRYDVAWVSTIFAWPFVLFGVASTLAWHRMPDSKARIYLYSGELLGTVIGLIALGPILVSLLTIDVLSGPGMQTHLRDTVAHEGLRRHQYATTGYARTDLVHTKRQSVAYVFTDAMFLTRSVHWDGESSSFDDPHIENLSRLKRVALSSGNTDSVLLLGAGAGFDIAVALQSGAQQIDAVEVNPQTISYARSLDSWAGGVLNNPAVNIHIAEARRYISASYQKWDHISLTLLQTSPAAGRGRSHIDARVLTVEAVRDYLSHLKPGGILAVIQNSERLANRTRLAFMAANNGQSDKIIEWRLPDGEEDDNPFSHLLITRNEPFNASDLHHLNVLAQPYQVDFVADPAAIDERPATDDRPFFFEPGLRISAYTAVATLITLIVLIGVSSRERGTPGHISRISSATITGAVAMGLQVLVVYRMQTAIGNPSLALGLALGTVLGGAGFGALLLGRRFAAPDMWLPTGLLAAFGVGLLVIFGPYISEQCASIDEGKAALLMIAFTSSCCLPIGLPFLAVIGSCESISGRGEGLAIGCDGLGGIIGAAGATGIAMTLGFNALGCVLVFALLAFSLLRPVGYET